MTHIQVIDLPCGYGKSSRMLASFKPEKKYIVALPYLSEVDRFVEGAREKSGVFLTAPKVTDGNKRSHAEKLIREGKSVAMTHQLYYKMGTLASPLYDVCEVVDWQPGGTPVTKTTSLLQDYTVIIDEAITPFECFGAVTPADFERDYVENGMADVDEEGRVVPTEKWDRRYKEGSKTFLPQVYERAKAGALYRVERNLYVTTVPSELLTRVKEVQIYTYLAEGSVLFKHLENLVAANPGTLTMDVERLASATEAEWRRDVASALTIKSVPDLEKHSWNHSGQLRSMRSGADQAKQVGYALRKLKRADLSQVDMRSVMLTCARDLWCAHRPDQKPKAGILPREARMFGHPVKRTVCSPALRNDREEWTTTGVQFVPNTTRGTNAHIACDHAIYLYDQNPNPQIFKFLGIDPGGVEARRFADHYALTELVQWLFRSAIRVGGINGTDRPYQPRKPVTVYMPSERMRNLLTNWLETGNVSSLGPDGTRPSKPAKSRKAGPKRRSAA